MSAGPTSPPCARPQRGSLCHSSSAKRDHKTTKESPPAGQPEGVRKTRGWGTFRCPPVFTPPLETSSADGVERRGRPPAEQDCAAARKRELQQFTWESPDLDLPLKGHPT